MECLNPNLGSAEKEEKKKIYAQVCKDMQVECFKQGDIVYSNGTNPDKFYLVLEGEVDGYLPDNDEKELVQVNQVRVRESFGQKALIYNQPRLRTMIAQKDTVCGVLLANDFQKILKKYFSLQETQQLNFLWEQPYLKKLDFKQVKKFHSACSFEKLSQNEYAFKEDIDPASYFYIIRSGTFVITKKFRPLISTDQEPQSQIAATDKPYSQIHYHPKMLNKKICELSEGDIFGLDDIIQENTRRTFSVQCQSKEGEFFSVSKYLFHLIIMSNPQSAALIQKINKKQSKKIQSVMQQHYAHYQSDSQNSSPHHKSYEESEQSHKSELTALNISQFSVQQNRQNENESIKNDQELIKKDTIDSQLSSQNDDTKYQQQSAHNLPPSPFIRYSKPKQLTAIPQTQYTKNGSSDFLVVQDKEDRRKSYTPNDITQDLISQLYKTQQRKSSSRSTLPMIPANYLSSPKNKLDISGSQDRQKSMMTIGQEGKYDRSDHSFSDLDNDHHSKNNRLSDIIYSPQTNKSDQREENLEELSLKPSTFSLQIRQSSNSQHSNTNIEEFITDSSHPKKKSYILNAMQANILKESLVEIASDDEEQQEQVQQEQNQLISLHVPENQAHKIDIFEFDSAQNGQNLQITKPKSKPTLPNICVNNTILTPDILQPAKHIGEATLRHLDEEEQLQRNFKKSIGKQNSFMSCYSYLPSINTTFFAKKKENPIDQIIDSHFKRVPRLDRTLQLNRQPGDTQYANRKESFNQGRAQSNDNQTQLSQNDISLYKTSNVQNTEASNNSNSIHPPSSFISSNHPQYNQPSYVPKEQLLHPQAHKSFDGTSTFQLHGSSQSLEQQQQNSPIKKHFNRSSLYLGSIDQSTQHQFSSQNNLSSIQNLEKNSLTKHQRSSSQEIIRTTSTPYQDSRVLDIEREYKKKMAKPKFLVGEKPKKEVIGVFNPAFFTSLKGKFIKQFTYNPQIFKDIQRYKFEDFLKKHLHDGPLHDYLEKRGQVESNAQKKKDQEDFKRQKKIIEDITTNAIENLQHFHRQQMRKSVGLISTVASDTNANVFNRTSKLNSLNLSQTQFNTNNTNNTNTSPIKKPNNRIHSNVNYLSNFNNSYQPKPLNLNTNQSQETQKQMQHTTTQVFQQKSLSPNLKSQPGERKKKNKLNFILSSNHLSQQKPSSLRLHSLNQRQSQQQKQGNEFKFHNLSQL